ncbi:glycosyltransferase [Noviherbaspirillum sedimenti]|uniref:Glycosyltransferase n=1 Tax=Noviherbaspirillum sedimenti TaxID=2320865 RepID=A0A3A3GIA7_9BURK|nr:glycosyltransferase [Noviherbaspirillum sedimenti]RJG02016.1 glycosyltransferase [Noviherbaspirillum sedimenti]
MKWGVKYGPEYVNRLYAMVRRHLQGTFRFVCLTDRNEGIRSEVECLPIPDLRLPEGLPERGWKKLTTFEADLHGLQGTALFLDLDVVITDSIDCFFEQPGEFLIIHDWKRPWRVTGNSSVYRFKLGAHADVLAQFRATQAEARKTFRNEQAYLSDVLHKQGKLAYWPSDWCCSYKYHCIPRWPLNYFLDPKIPAGTRIVIFHGEVNPPDALDGRRNRALRFVRRAPWIAAHWRE